MDENNNLQKNNQEANLKSIRTYSSDMADAVRENEASVIKIALAEQKRREMQNVYHEADGSNTKKIMLVIGGVILIAIALFGSYILINERNQKNQPAVITGNIQTLISYDIQSFIDMTDTSTKESMYTLIQRELSQSGKAGNIKNIFLTTRTNGNPELLSLQNFLSLLDTTAPPSLLRSLDSSYMVGSYTPNTLNENPHIFLLFQTKDYAQSYAGMLAWEKTLIGDMFALFQIDVSNERKALFEKPFGDIIIKNKDARVVYDENNVPVLYYLFIDKNTFIIADSSEVIQEVLSRLLVKSIKPL